MNNLNYEKLEKICQEKDRERRKGILVFFGFLLSLFVILLTINLIRNGNWAISKMIITFIVIILVMMYLLFVFLSEKQRLKRYLQHNPHATVNDAHQFLFNKDVDEQ